MLTTPISQKQLFVFDLDGTLAKSKTPMDAEMIPLFVELLKKRSVAVIGGGWLPVFEWQLLVPMQGNEQWFKQLYLFPTSGARFLQFKDGEWVTVYSHELSEAQRTEIKQAFERAFEEIHYQHPAVVYGEVIEDRGTQVTFSALGQKAPLELKDAYKGSPADRRREIVEVLKKYLVDYEIKIPGKSSIDVTMKGIDKGYGVEQMSERLGFKIDQMVFVGDALYEGGNDESVLRTGIDAIPVEGPEETMALIRTWLQAF